MGIAVPKAYARVIKKASVVTVPVRASEMTDAKIGPTQGVHNSPMENPIKIPPQNPLFVLVLGVNFASLVKESSKKSWILGINRLIPKINITTTENNLRLSAGMPISLTIDVRKRVKNVKLAINPKMTPSGRFVPPVKELDITIGNIGKIHGERTVTMPAIKEKIRRTII